MRSASGVAAGWPGQPAQRLQGGLFGERERDVCRQMIGESALVAVAVVSASLTAHSFGVDEPVDRYNLLSTAATQLGPTSPR